MSSWIDILLLISFTVTQISFVFAAEDSAVRQSIPHLSEVHLGDKDLSIQAQLSSKEVIAGTLTLVQLKFPNLESRPDAKQFLEPTLEGEFEGIHLPFFKAPELGERTYAAVLGIPYERKPGPAEVSIHISQGSISSVLKVPFQVIEGKYSSEILKVDNRRVHPTRKKDIIRIQAEQAEVSKLYQKITPKKYWNGPFILPIQSKITSAYGTKRIYNGHFKNFHPGLDLKAPMKTPVYSAAPGEVVLAKNLFFSGNTVMVDHGYGVVTLYCHLSQMKVKVGQVIKVHELVGLSGKTGRVNGPHLHWQAVVHQVKVNPLGLIEVFR